MDNKQKMERLELFQSPGKRLFLGSLILVAVVCFVYAPVQHYKFLVFDDADYITQNYPVQTGLNWANVVRAFKTMDGGIWHPLTWLSHMADCQFFGLNPAGHHLDSLLWHCCNAVLLLLVLYYVTGRLWRSLLVAALFALHPLDVQSVAWISERKNLISTAFWLLTMGAYAWYARKPDWKRYLPVLIFFIFGFLAKAMLMTMPAVLLLMDYWPLRRIAGWQLGQPGETTECRQQAECFYPARSLGNLLLEKIPLLPFTVLLSWISLVAQRSAHSDISGQISAADRLANALNSYVMYLFTMVWPAHLSIYYPHPLNTLPEWRVTVALLALVAITALVVGLRRVQYLTFGWLWYLGVLLPVIGLVQVGGQARADRYAYVPMIGILIMLVWGLADVCERLAVPKASLAALIVFILGALSYDTRIQLSYWHDSITLFSRTLELTPENPYPAHQYLGEGLLEAGRIEEALPHFALILQRFPYDAEVRLDYARALRLRGNAAASIQQSELALHDASGPKLPKKIYNNLGLALVQNGEPQNAIEQFQKALHLDPYYFEAEMNWGIALALEGKLDEAAVHLNRSVDIFPTSAGLYNLGLVLQNQHKTEEALNAFRNALYLSPDMVEAKLAISKIDQKR